MELTDEIKEQIKADSLDRHPIESCGFILNKKKILKTKNIAEEKGLDPTNFAVISPVDYPKRFIGIYHSHSNNNRGFSYEDGKFCKSLGVPLVLYSNIYNEFKVLEPSGDTSLESREFCFGVNDCFSLVKDYYKQILGIKLKDFNRGSLIDSDGNYLWNKPDWNMIMDNYKELGFKLLSPDTPLKLHDVIIMSLHGGNPNHLGVYCDPTNNLMLHQLVSKPSEKVTYGGYWQSNTTAIARFLSD